MATTNEQLIKAYQGMTAEQQAKTYSAGNSQVKRVIDAYKSTQNNTAQPQPVAKPTTQQIVQPQGLNTEQQQRLEQVKSSPVYQDMIKKGLTDEQITKAVSQYKPTNPVETPVQPQAETQPATPSATATQTPPAKYDGLQGDVELKDIEGSTTGMQLYKGFADYQDESQRRLQEIANNVRSYYTTSPEIFSSYDTYKNFFSYSDRIDQQKIVLDSFWQAKTQGEGLSSKSVSDLLALYSGGNIGTSDLQRLQQYNPSKYAELMAMISKQGDMEKYDSMLNGQAVNPLQSIIDAYSQNMLTMISAPTNMFAEYKEAMNSTTMKEYGNQLAEKEGEIKDIDLQLNSIKRDVEERYKGTGARRSKINAIIADESWKLSETRNRLAIEYQTLAQKYNNEMTSVRNDFELQLQEYQFNMQQQQQQMQQLGFMMQLVNFETNAQKDEREWNNFIRQQEYADGNIYSSDPATRRKAVSKAVDNILQEFAGIPMVRSREQMIEDIWNLVEKQGMSLGDAITKNIREPIMQKPEYVSWRNEKFGTGAPDLYNIGGQQMIYDSATQSFVPAPTLDITREQATQRYGNNHAVRNFNPGNISDTGFGGYKVPGERFTRFDTPEQGLQALVSKIKYNQTNSKSAYYGSTVLEYFERYAPEKDGNDPLAYAKDFVNKYGGITIDTKIADLDAERFASIIASHEDRGSFKMLQDLGLIGGDYNIKWGAGVGVGGAAGEVSGFDPTLASMYNKYTSGKNLTKTDWEAIMSTGVSQAQFMAQAQNYKAEEDKKLIPLVKNTLEDIDFLLNANIDYADWVNMNAKTPGTKGRNYRNYIEKIISSAALSNLIDLKSQGATFGALSDNELNFITQSSINLDVGTSLKTVKENLQKYKDLLTKGIDTAGGVAGQQPTQQQDPYANQTIGGGTGGVVSFDYIKNLLNIR